ncbi:MAG: ABC transporter permease [Pseudomonadota bacterium]
MSALNRMLARDLWSLRGQALAVALVVACGVASFVAMRATYYSLLGAQQTYYREYRFADVFVGVKRAPERVAERIREIPGVGEVRTRVVMEVTLDVPGLDEPATGRLVSIPERPRPMLNDLFLRKGRYVEPGRSDEAIASEAFAQANALGLGDRIGAIINGRWKELVIVGIALSPEFIYEVGGGTIFPDNRRFGVLWMSREVLGPAFDMEGAFNDVALSLAADADAQDVILRLDALLERYGSLGAYAREDQVSHRFIADEIAQNRVTSTYIPAIFLGVAAFLLHIVLTRLIALQRTQIALLKAFGYRNVSVGLHYLKLALAVVALGGAAGVALGLYLGGALTRLYRDFYHFPHLPFEPAPAVFVLAGGIGVLAAAVGALTAVTRAVALPPAEAMRPEAPASFRHGVLDRPALRRLLPASARMILRNLIRRRWKALASLTGIALAVGILVVGGYSFDAMAYLMRVQFELVQRDDVTVVFHDPASQGAEHELARMSGVLRAEPFRSVPVRLRLEHRSHRGEITGLVPGGDLRQLIDTRLDAVALPPDGLVLTTKLAGVLGAAAGDRVTVEVLEAGRPVREVTVTAVVDELVGTNAYMSLPALAAFMREDRALSGAYLRVDPGATQKLYRELKRTPAVAGVAVREALLESFDETLDRSIRVSSFINIAFACVIAFGMVYNGARIALSERGNELASLRVLGFTRREVTVILLGEQAILTLAAVPVGFAFGYGVSWLLSTLLDTELYRIPLVLEPSTFALAFVVVMLAALASGLLVARRIRHLDLIAVLKTRET